jgi:hypothetical protein
VQELKSENAQLRAAIIAQSGGTLGVVSSDGDVPSLDALASKLESKFAGLQESRFRFCGVKCRDAFLQARQAALDRRRAVAELYSRPP